MLPFKLMISPIVALVISGGVSSAETTDLVLPIEFDEFSTPIVKLDLDGAKASLMLDTGSAEGLHLTRRMIESVKGAHFTGETQKASNLVGQVREEARFFVDRLTIGGRTFRDVSGVEFTPWTVTLMGSEGPPETPVMGLGLFDNHRIVIDYRAKKLTVLGDQSGEDADPEHGWTEVPFRRTEEGVLLEANVSGQRRLMSLDSGASMSAVIADRLDSESSAVPCQTVYPNLQQEGCELVPVETNFGNSPQTVHAFLMNNDPGQFTGVGLLGGDFLFKHAVLIDLKDDRLFVRAYSPEIEDKQKDSNRSDSPR